MENLINKLDKVNINDDNDTKNFKKNNENFKKVNKKNKNIKNNEKKENEKQEIDNKMEIESFLKMRNIIWRAEMELERASDRNIPLAFIGVGNFGEYLCSLISGKIGSGSKGGCAFDLLSKDNTKADEVKTICLIQPKKCIECQVKIPYFQKVCSGCNKSEFKIIRDSRAGINVIEHFKYESKFENYWIVIIDLKGNEQDDVIQIKIYKIDAKNRYFNELLRTQKEKSKSRTTNLLPYSYDFYASGPEHIYDIELSKEKIEICKVMKILEFDTKVLTKKEKEQYEIKRACKLIQYNEIQDKLKIREKKYNKPRGDLTRNKKIK